MLGRAALFASCSDYCLGQSASVQLRKELFTLLSGHTRVKTSTLSTPAARGETSAAQQIDIFLSTPNRTIMQSLLQREEELGCNCDNGVLTTGCNFEADPDIVRITHPDA
jgi:hypothetical protein